MFTSATKSFADFRLQRISLGDELVVEDTKPRAWTEDTEDLNNQNFIPCEEKFTLRSISIIRRELPQSTLGWPLLRRTSQSSEALSRRRERNMSVVEWVMSLPSRSTSVADQNHMIDLDTKKISVGREIDNSLLNDREIEGSNLQEFHTVEESTDDSRKAKDENLRIVSGQQAEVSLKTVSLNATNLSLSKPGWPFLRIEASMRLDSSRESEDAPLPNRSTPATPQSRISLVSPNIDYDENCFTPQSPGESEVFLRLVSSSCKKFSYMELKQATSKFSSGNLIGEGGCSNVYKGCLPNGKLVAVKVLKSYREAWNDFSLEVDITSSLMNKNITPLMGVCIEDSNLILVYDFLPKGSLEESLHGGDKSSALPWEMRYKVAVEIAEALNYLHNECLRPVIHRDVKSSNILLSTEFQPQLSDFGLAIWGPTDSSYIIDEDVVGTFGYIAPEYFMHGKVSDKIDVYSFGVVLLEMLSGRRPIDSKSLNGQESLVKWAKPILESGDTKELLDPSLNNDIDIAQMQRMVLAANLCISQSPRQRPKVSQIVKLLRGENDAKDLFDTDVNDAKETGNQDDDDLLECGGRSYLDLTILDTDFDATSLSSVVNSALHFTAEQKQRFKLRDYLKMEQD
ncbi:Kinase family protein [Melia azedarach]|uniref:Kinase family protein n=1 Tax=Melia azedarach TaxID=155640 RepID=A0ACC1WV35_MELAZ|nr:Kinase family protein [Melia azedarach]